MNVKLIKLDLSYREALIEMYDEWTKDQIENHSNMSPRAIFVNNPHDDFEYYLNHLDFKKPEGNFVPTSTFFLIDVNTKRLLGAANIRHYLNEGLLLTGGHIGDGIRPSERRKGYGTEIIRLALIECKKLGISKVLMCCNKNNIGSRKCIIKNGGVLENEVKDGDEICQRYWIDLQIK